MLEFSVFFLNLSLIEGFCGGSVVKIYLQSRGRFDAWVWKILGEGNGYLLHILARENLMDRGVSQGTVIRLLKELGTT